MRGTTDGLTYITIQTNNVHGLYTAICNLINFWSKNIYSLLIPMNISFCGACKFYKLVIAFNTLTRVISDPVIKTTTYCTVQYLYICDN